MSKKGKHAYTICSACHSQVRCDRLAPESLNCFKCAGMSRRDNTAARSQYSKSKKGSSIAPSSVAGDEVADRGEYPDDVD